MYKTCDFFRKQPFGVGDLFWGGVAGFLGSPLVANTTTVGTGISEIANQANAEPDLDQAVAGSQPTMGRYPLVPGGIGVRNLFTTATTTFTTRTFTTTAVAYTFSFIGTGTVTLSGTSTAGPLVGTGASNRVSLTFTPTAGTLTLTVAGTVNNGQIELGSTATNYQDVLAAYSITEAGYPSVPMPYYGGDDFMSFGVTQFSATASLFADSAQRWSVGGVFQTFGTGGNILSKCGATGASRTFQAQIGSSGTSLDVNLRGTANTSGAVLTLGRVNAWLLVWNGTAASLYINSTTPIATPAGSASEEVQNIITSARTESAPAIFFTGFNNPFLCLAKTMNATEIAQFFTFCRATFGTV